MRLLDPGAGTTRAMPLSPRAPTSAAARTPSRRMGAGSTREGADAHADADGPAPRQCTDAIVHCVTADAILP